ncbi:hypothetical protein ASPVEDRAFT_86661 [Aspergillus versicolor CBS 583.65]|uniref:EthD domain-containing protein n=1 Tax=Aspergillus versicolor CBS 583.65 TaxID=1036611 RepID=A0A1L9PV50_ASPVE|nr:uncharacterized protein ASPVEDRAFT_86661 [Aspergillus versicolor CBS 583.65]OJJ05306.1 hypothetical protein ASPVEDRAFT_86661 [Aspergillus versicolor CBS 583.65]
MAASSQKDILLPQPSSLLIRVSCFFRKDPSISQEEFNTYWRDTHGSLVVASKIYRDTRIQGYTQVHNTRELSKEAAEMGLSVLDFEWDACSEMYFHSWEDYRRFAASDEMRDVLGPDGAHIMGADKTVRAIVSLVDPVHREQPL